MLSDLLSSIEECFFLYMHYPLRHQANNKLLTFSTLCNPRELPARQLTRRTFCITSYIKTVNLLDVRRGEFLLLPSSVGTSDAVGFSGGLKES